MGRFNGDQRVDHDPTRLTADEGDVGEVVAPHLVDTIHHLEETVHVVQLGLSPEARINAIRSLPLDEVVHRHIPYHVAIVSPDDESIWASDKTSSSPFEVGFVSKWKTIQYGRIGEAGDFARRFDL